MNVPSHTLGEHKECVDRGYFCDGTKKPDEENLLGFNNNLAESFNSHIGKRIGHKTKFVAQRGHYRGSVAVAVIHFNTGQTASKFYNYNHCKTPATVISVEAARRQKRIRQARAETVKRTNAVRYDRRCHSTAAASAAANAVSSACEPPLKKQRRKLKDNAHYGPSCEKPDAIVSVMKEKLQRHYEHIGQLQQDKEIVEFQTHLKSRNEMLVRLRKTLLFPNVFGLICRSRQSTSRSKLIEEILYAPLKKKSIEGYEFTAKRRARQLYETKYPAQKITDCGVIIDAENPCFATAPDGMIGDDCIVVIEAPFAVREKPAMQVAQMKIKNSAFFKKSVINENHHVFYRMVAAMEIAGKEQCVLIVCTKKGIVDTKISRKPTLWRVNMLPKLLAFYNDWVVPEIVDSRKARSMPLREHGELTKMCDSSDTEVNVTASECEQQITTDVSLVTADVEPQPTHAILPTGLIDDPEYYYLQSLGPDAAQLIVGTYQCADRTAMFAQNDNIILYADDFASLQDCKWIYSDVIDCFMAVNCLRKWQNVQCVTATMTNYMIGDNADHSKPETWSMYNLSQQKFANKIMMPFCYRNHWCLLVAETSTSTVRGLDPMRHGRSPYLDHAAKHFLAYVALCRKNYHNDLCKINWKLEFCTDRTRPLQTDGYNCGAFVMFYMDKIAGEEEELFPYSPLDPAQYRRDVANLLLRSSAPMQGTCLYCTRPSNDTCIKCANCQRVVHPTRCGATHEREMMDLYATNNFTPPLNCSRCQRFRIRND